jgi:predicted metalloendopeptidase
MIKYDGTKEQITNVLATLRSLRLTASLSLFTKIFGEEMGELYWKDYVNRFHSDMLAFISYLDDAYKDVLLNYLLLSTSNTSEAKE